MQFLFHCESEPLGGIIGIRPMSADRIEVDVIPQQLIRCDVEQGRPHDKGQRRRFLARIKFSRCYCGCKKL